MATTVTIKGQVTLPADVRKATGIKPGDRVEVRATAAGTVIIEPEAGDDYVKRLYELAKRRPLRDMSTDEFMEMSRGEGPAFSPKKK